MVALSVELGTTLVVSLHDVEVALGRFQRVVALREGRVRSDGSPAGLSEAVEDLYAIARPVADA